MPLYFRSLQRATCAEQGSLSEAPLSVRRTTCGGPSFLTPDESGHSTGTYGSGLTCLTLAGSGARIERGSTSPQIPSLPQGSLSRGEGLQDDRCPTRKGIPWGCKPRVRKLRDLVALQFAFQTQKSRPRGFCARVLPISCNPSAITIRGDSRLAWRGTSA